MNATWTWRHRLGAGIVKTQNTRGVGEAQKLGERHAAASLGHLSSANPWSRVSGIWGMNKFCCWKPFHLWCLLWSTTQIHAIRKFESQESYQKILMHTQVWEPPLPILVLSKNSPGMFKKINKNKQNPPDFWPFFLVVIILCFPHVHTSIIELQSHRYFFGISPES